MAVVESRWGKKKKCGWREGRIIYDKRTRGRHEQDGKRKMVALGLQDVVIDARLGL